MASIWTVGEFNPNLDNWVTYSEQVEFYLQANEVNDPEKKRAHLLSPCGAPMYKLICSLNSPATPQQSSYKDIV